MILAFYNFVRTADDIADHPSLPPEQKLGLLDRLEAGLSAATMKMRSQCGCATPLLRGAFAAPRTGSARRVQARRDQTALSRLGRSHRYCSLSAMPVGRFVCDVHGESLGLAGQRRVVRGAADHQPSAGLQGRLSQSRPRLCSAGRTCRVRPQRRSARRPRASPALLASARLAERTERLLCESECFSAPDQRPRGSASKSPLSIPSLIGYAHAHGRAIR